MALLLILSLLSPPLLYFLLVNIIFAMEFSFFSVLGVIGAFLVGAGSYQRLQAKLWQYEARFTNALFLSGATVIGVSVWLMALDVPTDEAELTKMLIRLFCIGFLAICYIVPRWHLGKWHKWEKVVFMLVVVVLSVLAVVPYRNPSWASIYFCVALPVFAFVAVWNARTVIGHNLRKYHQPFVLYRKGGIGEKSKDIFSDVLFIALPALIAVMG